MTSEYHTIWLLGASSGIGAELVPGLVQRTRHLIISARRREVLEEVRNRQSQYRVRTHVLPVDVTDAQGLSSAAQTIERDIGPLDLVIYNVGDYEPTGLDDLDPALFQRMIASNYLGAVNCLAAVVPPMRARRRGRLVVNASLSGYCGLPGAAAYGSTKAALINLAESLRPELERAGIDLRLINHGFVRTRLTAKNRFTMPFLMEAEEAAERILQRLDAKGFEIVFPGRLAWMLRALRLLPYPLFFAVTRRLL